MSDSSKWSTAVCPIGLASELACDKWMPIILRDIGLLERRTFNQLLKHNLEGISSGSLATKLKRLEHVGLITFVSANEHKQKKLYYLTESGIDSCRCYSLWQDGPQSGINRAPGLSKPSDLIYRNQNPLCRACYPSFAKRIWSGKNWDQCRGCTVTRVLLELPLVRGWPSRRH